MHNKGSFGDQAHARPKIVNHLALMHGLESGRQVLIRRASYANYMRMVKYNI